MKSRRKVTENLPMKMDLAGEIMPQQSLVEILGFGRVLIENHCGVIKYEPCEICVKTRFGLTQIYGQGMELAKMTKEQLVIVGTIDRICLEKRGSK